MEFFEAINKALHDIANGWIILYTHHIVIVNLFLFLVLPLTISITTLRYFHGRAQRQLLLEIYDRAHNKQPETPRNKKVAKLKKVFKVAYYIGDMPAWNSHFKTGYIHFDRGRSYFISKKDKTIIPFDPVYQVWKQRVKHIGKMLKVNNGTDYIYLCSAHFCVLHYFFFKRTAKTRKLYKILLAIATVDRSAPVSTQYMQQHVWD